MAGWFEWFRHLSLPEVEQGRKGQPHPAPFIGNGSPTPTAADFAGRDAVIGTSLAIEKSQQVQTRSQPHLVLMKDGSPLHRSAMQCLARPTVAELRIHGIGTHLVVYTATKTGGPVLGNK